MSDTTHFQYVAKQVILTADKKAVLLASRKGEQDYDGVYSFIGGKLETTDEDIVDGVRREKEEEIGAEAKVRLLLDEDSTVLFRKKDGNVVIVTHFAGIYTGGEIELSDEYETFQWVPVSELDEFEPKIANIPDFTRWAVAKIDRSSDEDFVGI